MVRLRPTIEGLEGRVVLSTISWNSGQPDSSPGVTTSSIRAQMTGPGVFEVEDYSFDVEQVLTIGSA
jgi:hypothetical protein